MDDIVKRLRARIIPPECDVRGEITSDLLEAADTIESLRGFSRQVAERLGFKIVSSDSSGNSNEE